MNSLLALIMQVELATTLMEHSRIWRPGQQNGRCQESGDSSELAFDHCGVFLGERKLAGGGGGSLNFIRLRRVAITLSVAERRKRLETIG